MNKGLWIAIGLVVVIALITITSLCALYIIHSINKGSIIVVEEGRKDDSIERVYNL